MKTERHGKRLVLDLTPNEASLIQDALENMLNDRLADNVDRLLLGNMIARIDVS